MTKALVTAAFPSCLLVSLSLSTGGCEEKSPAKASSEARDAKSSAPAESASPAQEKEPKSKLFDKGFGKDSCSLISKKEVAKVVLQQAHEWVQKTLPAREKAAAKVARTMIANFD